MVPRARPNGLVVSAWCRALVCFRVPCCRPVLRADASHGAAQFYVLTRPMVPRSSTCFRVPCCRASSTCGRASVLSAAQFYVLLRCMVPRAAQRFALLPRCGLDCYKRAARSTVGVSRSAALVEVGRRRMVSRSTAAGKLVVVGQCGVQSVYSRRRKEVVVIVFSTS